jgi:hypothetical protein
MNCLYCEEPVLPDEEWQQPEMHRECAQRSILGSVAHLMKRCSCFVPGSEEGDPPGLTKRAAARAAVRVWQLREGWQR